MDLNTVEMKFHLNENKSTNMDKHPTGFVSIRRIFF